MRLRDSLFSTLKFSKAKDAQVMVNLELSHNLSLSSQISCFQLAWLDGVIKMTDDERTDLKPQEEEEGEEVRSKPVIPMLNHLPEESVQVTKSMNRLSTSMMTSLIWLDMIFMITYELGRTENRLVLTICSNSLYYS